MYVHIACVLLLYRGTLLNSGLTWYLCSMEYDLCSMEYDLSLSQLLGNIRISDLGLAVELKEGQNKTKGYAGTPGKV